ncbi:hypothetical protein BDA96_05G027700 [Sorghum bicolor]|uniref:Uncharacterized protein n=2 Tax=Sorghum bicolor TaxID=4558 RepID=A0A921UF05_SORBI|nr:hypothetical protein BDA96_05G027700 [Sorghum bicolor]OQU82828.1 hypothetical protein SORBI_3005G027250 [Sorghum bicolor]
MAAIAVRKLARMALEAHVTSASCRCGRERVPCRGDRDLHVLRRARRDVTFADTNRSYLHVPPVSTYSRYSTSDPGGGSSSSSIQPTGATVLDMLQRANTTRAYGRHGRPRTDLPGLACEVAPHKAEAGVVRQGFPPLRRESSPDV